ILLNVFFIFSKCVKLGYILSEIVVQLRKLFGLHFLYVALEYCRLARKVFGLIFLREGNVHFHVISGLSAYKLVFESRNKGTGTKCQRIISALAALESSSVYKSLEIDGSDVSVLCSAVFHSDSSGVLLLLFLQFSLDLFVCHFCLRLRNFQSFILAQGYFRLHCNFCGKDESFARLYLCYVDLRLRNDLKIALLKSLAVLLRDQSVGRVLKEDSLAVHLLDHLSRRFAFTETGNGDSVFCSQICILHCLLQFLSRNLDSQLCHVFL